MYVIPWFLLRSCFFGALISLSGASVTLQIVGGQTSFVEKSEVQLLCTITPYNNIMTWFVDNVNYADCIGGSCGASSNKPYTFTYNFDEASGTFRLTIDSVNSSHANLLFACDDGNERKDVTFDVTEVKTEVKDRGFCNNFLCLLFLIPIIIIIIIIIICCCCCSCCPCYIKKPLTIKDITPDVRSIHITWTDTRFQCMSMYEITSEKTPGNGYKGRETSCNIDNLEPSTVYDISLSARRLFCCLTTKPVEGTVCTLPKPPEMPQVDVIKIGITEIEIKCQMNPAIAYLVSCEKFTERNLTDTDFKIDDLLPDETYEINVRAVINGVYSLPWSNKIHTKTVTPKLVKMTPSACTCKIEWTVPPFPGDSQLEYILEYCELENENEWKKQGFIKATETVLESLQPNTIYNIRVYAIYKSKVRGPSDTKQFTTKDIKEREHGHIDSNRIHPNRVGPESRMWLCNNALLDFKVKIKPAYEPESCILSWTVNDLNRMGKKFKYLLEYCLKEEDNFDENKHILEESWFQFEIPVTNYKIRVYVIYNSTIIEPPGRYPDETQSIRLPPIDTNSDWQHERGMMLRQVHKFRTQNI